MQLGFVFWIKRSSTKYTFYSKHSCDGPPSLNLIKLQNLYVCLYVSLLKYKVTNCWTWRVRVFCNQSGILSGSVLDGPKVKNSDGNGVKKVDFHLGVAKNAKIRSETCHYPAQVAFRWSDFYRFFCNWWGKTGRIKVRYFYGLKTRGKC